MAEDKHRIRNFANLLGLSEQGQLNTDLTAMMQEVVSRCAEHAEKVRRPASGSITLKVGFKVDEDGVVELTADANSKMPKGQRGRTVLWHAGDGTLSQMNPRQGELPGVVRDVTAPRETRSV